MCTEGRHRMEASEEERKGWTRMAEDWDRPVCSSVNRLQVEEKYKTKGWTKMAEDWDRPVCSSAFSLIVWCTLRALLSGTFLEGRMS